MFILFFLNLIVSLQLYNTCGVTISSSYYDLINAEPLTAIGEPSAIPAKSSTVLISFAIDPPSARFFSFHPMLDQTAPLLHFMAPPVCIGVARAQSVMPKKKTSLNIDDAFWLTWAKYVLEKTGSTYKVSDETRKAIEEYMANHPLS